jgi:hypothetical protein
MNTTNHEGATEMTGHDDYYLDVRNRLTHAFGRAISMAEHGGLSVDLEKLADDIDWEQHVVRETRYWLQDENPSEEVLADLDAHERALERGRVSQQAWWR